MSIGKALRAAGEGIGGYIQGTQERDRDDLVKMERDQKRQGLDLLNRFQKDMKSTIPEMPAADGIASQGEQPYKMPSIDKVRDVYRRYSMESAANPYAAKAMAPALNNLRSLGMSEYAKGYKGDISTKGGALDYAKYMAKGSAMFGDHMSPEQALKMAETVDEAESEGYVDALEAVHSGDIERATKLWNSRGKQKGEIVDVRPAKFNLGGQSFDTHEVVYRGRDGQEHKINAFSALFNTSALKEQVSMQLQAKKTTKAGKGQPGWDWKKIGTDESGEDEYGWVNKSSAFVLTNDQMQELRRADSSKAEPKETKPMEETPSSGGIGALDKPAQGGLSQNETVSNYKDMVVSLINEGHDTAPEMVLKFDDIAKNISPKEAKDLLDRMDQYIPSKGADRGRYNLMRRKYADSQIASQ